MSYLLSTEAMQCFLIGLGLPWKAYFPASGLEHSIDFRFLQEIAKDILEQQSPKQVHVVRSKLYELLVNCLAPELILRKMSQELMSKLDDQLRHKCSAAAAQYEHRLQVCNWYAIIGMYART